MSVLVVATKQEHARQLAQWGIRILNGISDKKIHILCTYEGECESLKPELRQDAASHGPQEVEFEFTQCDGSETSSVVDTIAGASPELVVVAVEASGKQDPANSTGLVRTIFERCHADVMFLRLGSNSAFECKRVLVPSSNGPNSRAALRIAHGVITTDEDSMLTPLYIEPDIDEVAEDVGRSILDKIIRRSGLKADDSRILPKVVVHDHVDKGIREAAEDGEFDLVLIGASSFSSMNRKLFSLVPASLVERGPDGESLTVGVVRTRRWLGERLKEKLEMALRLRVPQLTREDRIAVFEKLQNNSRWNFDFMALISLATAIAALGLIVNSTAVVIGAMLVAPLMTPIIGSGLALVQGNAPLVLDCVRSILLGFLFALLIGLAAGFAAMLFPGYSQMTPELANRGKPGAPDMLIALFSGIAASYCIARPNLASALAGVAISAALVPPIATTGISLAWGDFMNATGSAILFGINVLAIILGASISFYGAGIRGNTHFSSKKLWTRRILLGLAVIGMGLLLPVSSILVAKITGSYARMPAPLIEAIEAALDKEGGLELQSHVLRRRDHRMELDLMVIGDHDVPRELTERLAELAREEFDEVVKTRISLQLRYEAP